MCIVLLDRSCRGRDDLVLMYAGLAAISCVSITVFPKNKSDIYIFLYIWAGASIKG